jgi:predicted RNase H-like HicB family nuclease
MSTATTGADEQVAGTRRYSMLIVWSDEDNAYLVHLPEWEAAGAVLDAVTHGATPEEAARNGAEALESLMLSWRDLGWPLPPVA